MNTLIAIFVPIYFLVYLLVAFIWPTYRAWKINGTNPVTFSRSDSLHDYVGRMFKVTIGLVIIPIGFYLSGQDTYRYLLPANYLETGFIRVSGYTLCVGSLIWTTIAHYQMTSSWRVGIDEKNPAAFVVSGLFRFTRNPFFLGVLAALTGLFFLLPNAVTLLVMLLTYVLIQVQIRLEEEFLLRQYGEVYLEYQTNTPRLLY